MNTPVTRVSYPSDGKSDTEEQGETALHTPRGTVLAQKVVFATNAYTAGLVPAYTDIITPYKGMNSHHTPSSSPSPTPTSSSVCRQTTFPHLNHTYNIHFGPSLGTDYLNPRFNGSLVAGGGSWFFKADTALWYNNIDDSVKTGHFPQSAYSHWEAYVEATFLTSSTSNQKHSTHDAQEPQESQPSPKSSPESVWVGIQASTPDGLPHVGRVLGQRRQWVFAGFNGGGMSFIPGASRAVAKMVAWDLGFGDVKGEFGLLEGMGTGEERMR
ncbi:fad dependent oxidoreductase superfamily protein [Stemphylium lycopersici]|nr:fad dependent oxidoreductase superfamily protein [Stemphylium lycopersici]